MAEEENLYEDPEYKIFNRFDQIRDLEFRKARNIEQLIRLKKRGVISEVMGRNLVELLDINPAYYWPRKYRYSLEQDAGKIYHLTVQQRNQFERNGFLVCRELVSKNLLHLLRECPRTAVGEVLPLIINQRELFCKVKGFCGDQTRHIATMLIDNLYNQSVSSSEHSSEVAQLAQHFYQFNVHPADRLLGCLICVDKSNQLSVCLEPASHQSSVLEIEMRGVDGELVKKIYEKPIRRLDALNEQSDRRQTIILRPGDVFFYHPLLAQSVLFGQPTSENPIENIAFDLIEGSETRILALNVFYGSADLKRVIRDWGTRFDKSATIQNPLQRLKLVDQLLDPEDDRLSAGPARERSQEQDPALEQPNDDLKSFNVQIYIGNSIVNLEQVLADVGQDSSFAIKSHL